MGRVPEPHKSPTAPEDHDWSWTAGNTNAVLDHGGWDAMVTAHAWYDPAADEEHDPPQVREAYKFPHHDLVDGELKVVWSGVRAAMNVLSGGRGGANIPEADHKDLYRHLAEHYAEFGREAPDFAQIER